jgi:two-component system, LytTR family, sensor kinase
MKASPFPKKITLLIHVLVWVLMAIVLFLLSPLSWKVELPNEYWVKQGLLLAMLIGVFYFNMHVLAPKLLFKGKTGVFLLVAIGSSVCFLLFIQEFEKWIRLPELMHYVFRPNEAYVPKPRNFTYDLFILLLFFFALGISTSEVSVQKWQADAALRRQMEKERVNSELSYLKAQINPHFFFNTLNNIYALTTIDVDRAQKGLLKLSRMMRYVLYETGKDKTLLSKELEFIKDYIELMRLRLSEKVLIELDLPERLSELPIAPMLLLPFVENCFKHGVSTNHPSYIKIRLFLQCKVLYLQTRNRILPSKTRSAEDLDKGIGLMNTKRRLSLIYGDKSELQLDNENPDNEYRVDLKIDLS